MPLPRIVVTGASGFIGRHLLDGLKDHYRILALARRSQLRCGAPFHENINWFQVDICDRDPLAAVFRAIQEGGGAEIVIHLAAHYDFTGEKHPEYWRTNVDGLRNILEECVGLQPRRFVFASSVAACAFPDTGARLNESSPPDGDHVYAITKSIGEKMLAEYDGRIPSCIIRFAALYSDWCEYPPLYFFLQTWLSRAWNSRILGGRGLSAIPYLHVRDGVGFIRRLLERIDTLKQREIVIASPDGAVNHRGLFNLATLTFFGNRRKPVFVPKPLARVGVWGRDLIGRVLGDRPFERPWMLKYLDDVLAVDSSRTRANLGWEPRARLHVSRRLPFLVEHLKTDPEEWHRRNQAAMKMVKIHNNLRIHRLLEKHQEAIRKTFLEALVGSEGSSRFPSYQRVTPEVLAWRLTVIMRHLMNAVRTGEKGVFTAYCRDLAERRMREGFHPMEVCGALETLNRVCRDILFADEESADLETAVWDHITMTIQFGCDQIQGTYEDLGLEV